MNRLFISVAVFLTVLVASLAGAQDPGKKDAQPPKAKSGLTINDSKAFKGYTLLAPMNSTKIFLIDMDGKVVNNWVSDFEPGESTYLLANGNLLRAGKLKGEKLAFNPPPGNGGRLQEFTWDGKLVWDYKFANDKQLQHHDICPMPNGNVLIVAWEKKTAKEVLAAGRFEKLAGDLLPDAIFEIKKTGETTADIVWEWHVWDHLIQDFDKEKGNFGDVAAHPELVDLNFGSGALAALLANKDDAAKLKSLGYLGGGGKKGPASQDWTHVNAIAYNAALDQIMVSVHELSEVWIIDHSTTTAEAKGHTGGKRGKGGDLIYRWGNPLAYRAGKANDQQLYGQHCAHWIPDGVPGAGNILVFNNGLRRPGNYSSIDEIVPPVDKDGNYLTKAGTAFGPEKPVWSYTAPKKADFYSMLISGAQRLPNGNTLICAGTSGRVFEVTHDKGDVVWEYMMPSLKGGGKAFTPPPGKDKGGVGKGGPGPKGGGPGANSLFRANRYGVDYPGFKGRELKAGMTIEEMLASPPTDAKK